MKYTCPVCGFDGLLDPPADHTICPCCSTHFGYQDLRRSHADLRHEWMIGEYGTYPRWWSKSHPAPEGWSLALQLHTNLPGARISVDPEIMGGAPCIKGTRVPVHAVIAVVAARCSIEEAVKAYPHISVEDVKDALVFSAEAVVELGINKPKEHDA